VSDKWNIQSGMLRISKATGALIEPIEP
jgi:hypothetical protein